MQLPPDIRNRIVGFEIGSPDQYDRTARSPVWPGGASGITIGIGYDLGYRTSDGLRLDWGTLLPATCLNALAAVCGMRGDAARVALSRVRLVTVPLDAAMQEFDEIELPRQIGKVTRALENCDDLPPACMGALVSLVYNRGEDFTSPGDRRKEMRGIRQAMQDQDFEAIPDLIRGMKRLWAGMPGMRGLLARRDWEADTFEAGLASLEDPALPEPPIPEVAAAAPISTSPWDMPA